MPPSSTAYADAHRLRYLASQCDAQRGQLPSLEDPHRIPDRQRASDQIQELSRLVATLSRTAAMLDMTPGLPTRARAAAAFASAVEPAARAMAALGSVQYQLASLDRLRYRHALPGSQARRETALAIITAGLDEARDGLNQAALTLRTTATFLDPPPATLARAALTRSTTPVPAAAPPQEASLPATPSPTPTEPATRQGRS
jgi:hypothetical protein